MNAFAPTLGAGRAIPGISGAGEALQTRAPAKINLTLHVLGRRADGYHELESLVAFAGVADLLTLGPGPSLSLTVTGPTAGAAGPPERNLVVRAAEALRARRPALRVGAFHLVKRLPAAAGIGGGSSDAAAALRLLAAANELTVADPDVVAAARDTGADVPVCLEPRARLMRGAGEEVGPPLLLPPLFAVLVNPGVALATAQVFRALGLSVGEARTDATADCPPLRRGEGPARPDGGHRAGAAATGRAELLSFLAQARNDLEPPAITLAPGIAEALGRLRATDGCRLARMSGSGATVFGLYDDCRAASGAARALRAAEPGWWVKPTVLR